MNIKEQLEELYCRLEKAEEEIDSLRQTIGFEPVKKSPSGKLAYLLCINTIRKNDKPIFVTGGCYKVHRDDGRLIVRNNIGDFIDFLEGEVPRAFLPIIDREPKVGEVGYLIADGAYAGVHIGKILNNTPTMIQTQNDHWLSHHSQTIMFDKKHIKMYTLLDSTT